MTRHGCSRERTWGLVRFHPAMDDDFQLFSLTQQLIIRLGRILQGAEPASRSFTGAGRAPAPGLGHQKDTAGLERCFESAWAPCAQHLGALSFLLLALVDDFGAGSRAREAQLPREPANRQEWERKADTATSQGRAPGKTDADNRRRSPTARPGTILPWLRGC